MIVNWAHVWFWIVKKFFCPFNFVPIVFDSWRNYQMIVVKFMTFISDEQVFGWVDFGDSFLGPMALLRNDFFHFFNTDFRINHIESNHGPTRLVIMVLSWLKDSDISGSDVTSQEMRCSVETSCTTTDDTVFCVMIIEDDKSFPDEHFVLIL